MGLALRNSKDESTKKHKKSINLELVLKEKKSTDKKTTQMIKDYELLMIFEDPIVFSKIVGWQIKYEEELILNFFETEVIKNIKVLYQNIYEVKTLKKQNFIMFSNDKECSVCFAFSNKIPRIERDMFCNVFDPRTNITNPKAKIFGMKNIKKIANNMYDIETRDGRYIMQVRK